MVGCVTQIKYKRLFDSYHPHNTVDFLAHALHFFTSAFRFQVIHTDNGIEFTYTQFPHTKVEHPVTALLTQEV